MKKNTVILKAQYKEQIADFIRMYLFKEFKTFKDEVRDTGMKYNHEESVYFMSDMYNLLNLLHKIDATATDEKVPPENFDDFDIEVSFDEAVCYEDMVEMSLCDIIREDEEIENPKWLYTILNFYNTCNKMLEKYRAIKQIEKETQETLEEQ